MLATLARCFRHLSANRPVSGVVGTTGKVLLKRIVACFMLILALYTFNAFHVNHVNQPVIRATSALVQSSSLSPVEDRRNVSGRRLDVDRTTSGQPVSDAGRSLSDVASGLLRSVFGFVEIPARPKPLCPIILAHVNDSAAITPPSPAQLAEATRKVNCGSRCTAQPTAPGGSWSPPDCTPRHRIAIIVPYRDREPHLVVFLDHMHPFLQRQRIEYTIYVVEQTSTSRFNRGMLMNIGFAEARRLNPSIECFFFHDIDLLPENDLNIYSCPDQPRHVSAAVSTFDYQLPYQNIFGGVEAFRSEHFELINGFSNMFFGWGGEDDDLYHRTVMRHLKLTRYPMSIARYRMQTHKKDVPNPTRMELLNTGPGRMENDGLNSLKYERKALEKLPRYTRLLVDIDERLFLSRPTQKASETVTTPKKYVTPSASSTTR